MGGGGTETCIGDYAEVLLELGRCRGCATNAVHAARRQDILPLPATTMFAVDSRER